MQAEVERAREAGERVRRKMEAAGEIPGGDEERRGPEFALEILAYLVASRGEELADVLDSSKGDFPLRFWELFDEERQAVRILHDKEPSAIQHTSRVQEAMENLDSAERRVSDLLTLWFGPTNLKPDMWDHRERFNRRSVKNRRYPEVDERQEGSKALES